MAFVDLTKAFDIVSRDGIYIILSKLGCPEKLLNIIKSRHIGMKASLTHEGMESSLSSKDVYWHLYCLTSTPIISSMHSTITKEELICTADLTQSI